MSPRATAVKADSPAAGRLRPLDWDALARPILVDGPAGPSLRYEGTYDRIADARREDDTSLPRGVWVRKEKRADWATVVRECQDALEERSKDLQFAAWMSEGLLNLRGFVGLSEGLRVVGLLLETFWEDLHPALDEGDADARAAVLDWLNERLATAVKFQALTDAKAMEGLDFSFADWEIALQHERERVKDAMTRTEFFERVEATSTAFYRTRREELVEALSQTLALHESLPRHFGDDAPSLKRIIETLEQIHGLVAMVLTERGEPDPAEAEASGRDGVGEIGNEEDVMAASKLEAVSLGGEPEDMDQAAPLGAPPGTPLGGALSHQIASREEAYRNLAAIADYLMRVEPHSPTPFLLRRAISWRNKGFHELLAELVESPADLERVYTFLGVRPHDGYGD